MEEFKNLKEIIELCKDELENNDENVNATLDFEDLKELQNLINKNKELEKERDGIYADYQELGKEKLELETMVELMSSTIHQLAVNNDIAKYFPKRYCKTYYSGDISKCKDLICETCVKNYFRKKAKGE